MEIVKEYTNNEMTVVWKPGQCIHSEKCWRGSPMVFKPKEKPWVDMEGATTKQIIEQVDKCPSGALSYYMNNEELEKNNSMSNIKVQVIENGPLMVTGSCEITHKDGTTELKEKAAYCRCGHSSNKPFCDGAHKKEGFQG